MKTFKFIYIVLIIFCPLIMSSCKKSGKEIVEKIATETTEKTAKGIAKETSEKTLKTLTKKELRSIDWKDLMKLIKKENINLADALSHLDGSFQRKIGKAIQSDYDFYSALISSNRLIDEFSQFTKNAPKATDNIYIFKYFAKCRDLERRFGVYNTLGNIGIKDEMCVIKFFNEADNTVIGEFRDGIFQIKEPFSAGKNLLVQNSILKQTLIPNAVYRIKGTNGVTYLYHVDDLGRFSKIEATGIDANELLTNVVLAKENLNLGADWTKKLRTVRQTSKGNDIDATIILKYTDDETTPLAVKADIKANNKQIISESFENLDYLAKNAFTTAENASLLNKFASKTGLSTKKKADLLSEMGQDEELAKLIHSNPELNIRRWLNTRNPVDKSKVARTANGRMVLNGEYAGNVYYFNPHLNSKLRAKLKNGPIEIKKFGLLTYYDFIKLDELYPEGVPFSKEGYPDFSQIAFKDKKGKALCVNIGKLSDNSEKDRKMAQKIYLRMGYPNYGYYTWHHIENSSKLMRVPESIHDLIKHAGGRSTHKVEQTIKQAA